MQYLIKPIIHNFETVHIVLPTALIKETEITKTYWFIGYQRNSNEYVIHYTTGPTYKLLEKTKECENEKENLLTPLAGIERISFYLPRNFIRRWKINEQKYLILDTGTNENIIIKKIKECTHAKE